MKHTKKKITDESVEININATEVDLKDHLNAALKVFAKDLSLPGFRKGKVPLAQVQKNVDASLLQNEVLDKVVNKLVFDVVNKEGYRLIDQPEVEITKFVPYEELIIKVVASIIPPIKLADYAKIKKKPTEPKVEEAEVDKVLNNIQVQNADKKEVDRKAKQDDEVWIDFSGVDKDGKPAEGAKGTDYPLKLGSNTFIPGFEEAIVGLKKGDEKTFDTKFPKDYRAKTLAGVTITFTVKVKKVNEVILPEITDELAEKVGPFKSKTELEAAINKELFAQKTKEVGDKLKEEIVAAIVEKSTVPTPETLIDDQVNALKQDFEANLRQRGMTFEQYVSNEGKTVEEFEKETLRPDATRRVKAGLVISEVAKKEGISVSKEELETQLSLMAEQNPNPQFAANLQKDEVQRDFHSRLVTQKTLDRLVEICS